MENLKISTICVTWACEAILNKPLNYFQGAYHLEAADLYNDEGSPHHKEACGTAFCRAGWMVALIEKPKTTNEWSSTYICDKAEEMLTRAGIPYDDVDALFSGGAIDRELADNGEYRTPKVGTPAYAEAGAAGLRAFMAKHESKLKAAPVTVED